MSTVSLPGAFGKPSQRPEAVVRKDSPLPAERLPCDKHVFSEQQSSAKVRQTRLGFTGFAVPDYDQRVPF